MERAHERAESWPGNRRRHGDLKLVPGRCDRGRSASQIVGHPGPIPRVRRRLRRSALVAVAMLAAMPGTAYAHAGGRIATDFEARLTGLRPPAAGVHAQVLGGDQRLQLTVTGSHVVVVLGLLGEPFLRFSPAGVDANAASPTAWNSGVVSRSAAVTASHGPAWRRVTGGHTFAWHENRLRPRPIVAGGATTPTRVAAWSVPLLVDGRRTRVTGWEWYAAGPSLVPWIAACAVLLAAAGAAVRYTGRAAQRALAAALVPIAVTAWLAGWIGILLFGTPSALVIALAAAYAAVTVLLVAAAVTATAGNGRMAAAGIVGALAAVFTAPEVEAFTRGFVFSALPASAARGVALVSFTGGIALAAVCVPAMADILSDDPLRRRLLTRLPDEG